ncbi:MAG: hypothetical protein C5B60_03870 [Chloroflexi bacterium]|nr:MAG: hypothetical protein C5B60_03870 [Chloroflexota bacterium]
MTVNQILQEMSWRLGNRSDINPRILTWLNDAYFELLLTPRFTFFQIDRSYTWVASRGVYIYQVSTATPDLWFIIDVRNEVYQTKLRRKDPTEFDRTWRIDGIPERYTRFQDHIEIFPTPDMDYPMTTRYRVRPPELEQGGAHMLTREWDEVLTTMAVTKGWESLEQWDKANSQKTLTELQLSRRFDAFQMDDIDSEATIGVEYGPGYTGRI